MATWAIGDIQGCYDSLQKLLETIAFHPKRDRLIFVGDLINRGAKSLETLRFVRDLGKRAVTVLGNHDLHLLAIAYGGHNLKNSDTFQDVLDAPDRDELCEWLRELPLMHEAHGFLIVHAGIPHIWDLQTARSNARKVENAIAGRKFAKYFKKMYGNQPARWSDDLTGMARLRTITNYFTRMRFIALDGTLELTYKGTSLYGPPGYSPWFAYRSQIKNPQVFGHWASLEGCTNQKNFHALDTGCVWGRSLTAYRIDGPLEQHRRVSVQSEHSDLLW